jgi:mannose-6-phosphate isomerase-like protein (cupin superfamily)
MVGSMLAFAMASGMLIGAVRAEEAVTFTDLDSLLKQKPPLPGEPPADIVAAQHVGASELQLVVAKKIDLHAHEDTVHRIYVARGKGIFHFAGRSRRVKGGDILTIPKRVVHGFETARGAEPLVLLVVETPE